MNASKEIVLRINPEEQYIKVENINDGVTSFKEITGDTFYQCIKASVRREAVESGFLPPNWARQKILCKRYSTKVKNGALWEAHNMAFPLSASVPAGWGGMRAACGVNAALFRREHYDKREINRPFDLRTEAPVG